MAFASASEVNPAVSDLCSCDCFSVSVWCSSESNTVDMARTDDDESLVGRFRVGEEAAFDEIVARFQFEKAVAWARSNPR